MVVAVADRDVVGYGYIMTDGDGVKTVNCDAVVDQATAQFELGACVERQVESGINAEPVFDDKLGVLA